MGGVRVVSLIVVALAAGLGLCACGGGEGGELLPGTTADQITANLDQVRASFEEGNCERAETGVAKVSTEVDELREVDARLKKALRQGAAKLSEVVSSCGAAEEAEVQAAEEAAEEEREQLEAEQLAEEEEQEALEKEQRDEERQEKKPARERAEERAEQPGPKEGAEPKGKAKGHEKPEESVPSPSEGEEEVTPPGGGPAGGIGPGTAVEGAEG